MMPPTPLTPRQLEVARLVARGMSSKQIAETTGLALQTVLDHIKNGASRVDCPGRPRHRLTLFVLQIDPPDQAA